MDNFDSFLERFKKNFTGKKLSVVAAGGGVSILDMIKLPGASQILHSFQAPYATEESVRIIKKYVSTAQSEEFQKKCVSSVAVHSLFLAEQGKYIDTPIDYDDLRILSITAALTTHRYRRGDNHAYIHNDNGCWHLKLTKLPEYMHDFQGESGSFNLQQVNTKRIKEDQLISRVSLCLTTGFELDSIKGLEQNETLRSI